MNTVLAALIFALTPAAVLAQKTKPAAKTPAKTYEFHNAIGVRAGNTSGLTFKHMMGQSTGLEFILGVWQNGIGITGLYEKYASAGIPGLKLYYGIGGHFTGETNRYLYRRHENNGIDYVYRYGKNGYGIGADGILGIEYKIPIIPIALSFDLKPYFEVSNYGTIYTALDPGLGLKVTF